MKGKINMFYRNIFEYLGNKQNPNDIYFSYRKQKESFTEQINVQAAGVFLLNEAAAVLKPEIQKAMNKK